MEVKGAIDIFVNGNLIREIQNAWTWVGVARIACVMTGIDSDTYYKSTLCYIDGGTVTQQLTNIDKGPSAETLNVLWCYGQDKFTPITIWGTLQLRAYSAVLSSYYNLSSVSVVPPITLPAGWTLEVDWRSTFTGSDYTNTQLYRIPYKINTSTINSGNEPNSIKVIYSGGSSLTSISEAYYQSTGGYTVVIYKGSFLTGAMGTIGTVQIYRNAETYSTKAITVFDKPTDVELYIEHRNTILP